MTDTTLRVHKAGTVTLMVAVMMMLWSIWVGFIQPDQFSLAVQITAHIAVMLAGGLMKVGYVIRLATEHESNTLLSH